MKNKQLVSITYVLIIIGFIFISLSSEFFLLKKQSLSTIIGTFAFIIASKINLQLLKKYSLYLFILSGFTLFLVLIPGFSQTTLGAKRWLQLGFFSFQPTETFKIISIIYFSTLFSKEKTRTIQSLLFSLLIPLVLILAEPNMSTAVLILSICLSIYYLSGANTIQFFLLCLIGIIASIGIVFLSPYRNARLNTFLNPQNDPTGISYHSKQNILTLASGGLFGKGIGNSKQKYSFLPQLSTDSIFAIIGEELGFFGSTAILLLYFLLINSILAVSKNSKNQYHQLLCIGIACWIAYQSIINISATSAIIPLTGIPLPFVSYGGSSLICLLFSIGLVYNIYKINKKNAKH
ncbi:putative lipid II flippase FtsW [Patescibacteria group bacterium]|nr:putative lipid II flippase FtsW [Patescibacteria group bacterium]